MKKNLMISIIIPVYNAEKYIEECIKSILNQEYPNFEIIIVDDGSKDNSFEICKKLKNTDKRIRLYRKNNGGVSSARNYGIDKSLGDYIMFLDSDDYYIENALAIIANRVYESNFPEFVKYKYLSNHNGIIQDITSDKKIYDGELLPKNFFENYFLNSCFTCLFKRKIIIENNIRFNKDNIYAEDLEFCMKYFDYCKNYNLLDEALYIYRIHDESAIHKFEIEKYKNKIKACFNVYSQLLYYNSKWEMKYNDVFIKKRITNEFICLIDHLYYQKISYKQRKILLNYCRKYCLDNNDIIYKNNIINVLINKKYLFLDIIFIYRKTIDRVKNYMNKIINFG